jgi:hypothetical protein
MAKNKHRQNPIAASAERDKHPSARQSEPLLLRNPNFKKM